MKNDWYLIVGAIVLVVIFLASLPGFLRFLKSLVKRWRPKPELPEVSAIVTAVQKALAKSSKEVAGHGVSKVKLTLQTDSDLKVSGKGKYIAVALEGYYEKSTIEEIEITLKPVKGPLVKAFAEQELLTTELSERITDASRYVDKCYRSDAGALQTDQIDIQISFVVTRDAKGEIENKWTIKPALEASLSASGEYSAKVTHKVTVTFGGA